MPSSAVQTAAIAEFDTPGVPPGSSVFVSVIRTGNGDAIGGWDTLRSSIPMIEFDIRFWVVVVLPAL
jgi:hypothetical protein